jgi:putative oxidoreductase
MKLIASTVRFARPVIRGLESLTPLLLLGIRLWVANVFWKSGLTKIQTWESTLALFTYEYHVPFLSPSVAAVMGTTVELCFPVLLALGLAGRLSAGVLFVFNIIAVISYPDLNEVGLKDHQYWGILLLIPLLYGPGRISIDHFLRKRWMGENQPAA